MLLQKRLADDVTYEMKPLTVSETKERNLAVPRLLHDCLHMLWALGRTIGKGIDFPVDSHNFGSRNRTDFRNFGVKHKVRYAFPKRWYNVGHAVLWYKLQKAWLICRVRKV